jgi:hypothetical protein
MKADLYEHVTMTLTWGCDEAQQVFEHLEARSRKARRRGEAGPSISTKSNESTE